jgi:hypothetical protein
LGAQLALPANWTYAARNLDEPLVMRAIGQAIVVQDELENTYQRLRPADTASGALPVLADGTGTICSSDAECTGLDASHCVIGASNSFCTVQGCVAGGCDAPYVCCHDCNEAFASFLPFEGSACIPEVGTSLLTGTPGCTCD